MKIDKSTLIFLVIGSLFVGIILCAIFAGAVFPGINQFVAGPLVCRGTFLIHQDTYSYRPGETDTMTTDYCIDVATGVQRDVSFQTLVVAGLVDSVVIFIILLLFILVGRARAGTKK